LAILACLCVARRQASWRFKVFLGSGLGVAAIGEGSVYQEAAQSQEQEAWLAKAKTPEKLACLIPSVGTERPAR